MNVESLLPKPALSGILLALIVGAPAAAQLGPRTLVNPTTGRLDSGGVGDQLGISSSDKTTKKMELIRELQYLEPDVWQRSCVTWLRFREERDGEVVITEEGPGVIRGIRPVGKWKVQPAESGGWQAVSTKGGKLDLYLDTLFFGQDFTVGAVVPKFDGEAVGAVYRGTDFLFFVVQKKLPDKRAG